MRNILLTFVFVVLSIGLYAQNSANLLAANYSSQSISTSTQLQIFPNPAVNYIGVTDSEDAEQIVVYNLVGSKMKSFSATNGEKYYIGDLKRGMYLIQILGDNNKVLTTQRVSKK